MNEIKDKIAKLLAMAQDGRGNTFEEEAALRQAEKLMRKHNIDIAELQARTGTKPIYNWKSVSVPAGAPMPLKTAPLWFNFLATGIANFTDCKAALTYYSKHGMCIQLSGDEVDVEYGVWLLKHLRDAVRRESSLFPGTKVEKESFRKAYVGRVCKRMIDMRAERDEELGRAVTSSGSTALTVVNAKIALRDEEFGKPQVKARKFHLHGADAINAGLEAADKANLRRPLFSDT